jgi:putative ABC transport system permease protein
MESMPVVRSIILRQSLRALWRNKLRSFLTLLGLVTGVASFICVVGFGQAGAARVEEQLQNLGDNMIWIEAGSRNRNGVRAGTRGTRSLVLADADAIRAQVPLVRSLSPNVDGRMQVVYGNQNWNTTYRGVTPEYLEIRKWQLNSGTMFTADDVAQSALVCVLGNTVLENLFPEGDAEGKIIRVNGLPCKVIGTMHTKGASATGFDQDDFVMMPYTTVQKRITGQFWLDDIFCSAASAAVMPEARREITQLLRERHHLNPGEDDDFNIRSPEDLIQIQLASAEIFTLLLAGIASLSLLVGGIGITNIMLVSVTERTREIGVRLAVGATEREIRAQFLAEAVAISTFGGLLGVVAAYGGAILLENGLHWQIALTKLVVAAGCLFSVLLGVFFGYYPANRAARLNPIEALRYE